MLLLDCNYVSIILNNAYVTSKGFASWESIIYVSFKLAFDSCGASPNSQSFCIFD